MTIIGKILVSKTYGVSNLILSKTMEDVSQDILEGAQREISKFIWGYKPAKIRHSTFIGGEEQGGLRSIDIKKWECLLE